MKKILIFLIIAIGLSACKTTKIMTVKELEITNSANMETPFRVLLTTNEQDSLFLRKKSIDIKDAKDIAGNKDWQHFIERLKMTMAVESGVGIAAPQVGVGRNLFLFMRLDKPGMPVEAAINPRIVNYSDELIAFEGDGCLSVPELSGTTTRYAWIDVEYYNQQGELIKERLHAGARGEDFTGVIFQHEFDHLQGILFTDRLVE